MRGLAFCVILVISGLLLSGCCSSGSSYMGSTTGKDTYQCSSCSVCSTCGYSKNYRDSAWY
jgi:hypothetical protein